MKLRSILFAALAPAVLLSGCDNIFGLDNYDEPDATLTGRVVFDGQPVQLRSMGVTLQLRQEGFDLDTPMSVHVAHDGTFSASIFNGSYKLNTINNVGPWRNSPDTLRFQVSGTTNVDVPVTPYYSIRNPQIVYNPNAGTLGKGRVEATFDVVNHNVTDPPRLMEFVALYVAVTPFADRTGPSNLRVETARTAAAITARLNQGGVPVGGWGGVSQVVNLPADIRITQSPAIRNHVYARVGVKTVGLGEMIFSPVVKLDITSAP